MRMKRQPLNSAIALIMAGECCVYSNAGKKKSKEKKPEKEAVVMNNESDTLSYVAGMSMTQGLIPFLTQSLGVDTTYMADFVKGFQEAVKATDDPQFKAYSAGIEIAKQVKEKMLPGLANDLKDSPDSLVEALALRGFTDALQGDTTYYNIDKEDCYSKTCCRRQRKQRQRNSMAKTVVPARHSLLKTQRKRV